MSQAIVEKRAPVALSIAASIAAVAFCGYLWYAGAENPRVYHSNMAFNYHNQYSAFLTCYDCHRPEKSRYGMALEMSCHTAGCHGEYDPSTSREDAFAMKLEEWGYYPDAEERANHFLDLHEAFSHQECWTCHAEHTVSPRVVPEGWTLWSERATVQSNALRNLESENWTSLLAANTHEKKGATKGN
ncbi:MAG: hypothetical protein JJU11_16245 [Candidatus Sumerlaeia bacterium]|nr:hypothetical protein [Candidatus Sumerlaeia bacterium]